MIRARAVTFLAIWEICRLIRVVELHLPTHFKCNRSGIRLLQVDPESFNHAELQQFNGRLQASTIYLTTRLPRLPRITTCQVRYKNAISGRLFLQVSSFKMTPSL
jgi:hypothetical protein